MNRIQRLLQQEVDEPYYTLTAAAEKLGWSTITLRKRLLEGSIIGNKLGRKWIIPHSEIEKLLTGNENGVILTPTLFRPRNRR